MRSLKNIMTNENYEKVYFDFFKKFLINISLSCFLINFLKCYHIKSRALHIYSSSYFYNFHHINVGIEKCKMHLAPEHHQIGMKAIISLMCSLICSVPLKDIRSSRLSLPMAARAAGHNVKSHQYDPLEVMANPRELASLL